MTSNEIKKGFGLLPTPYDERDFHFEAVFGATHPQNLPESFKVGEPIAIKDQGLTDMCTAYALTAVSEDQEGVLLDPFFTFALTKKIMGEDPSEWGADLRSACKSAVIKYGGFLPAGSTKFNIELTASDEDRDQAARLLISQSQKDRAKKYAKKSFFTVKGSYDMFDNIRSAMWRARDEKRSVFFGMNWYPSWNRLSDGVIKTLGSKNERTFGHALKLFGWEGEYMLAQLSNGKNIGAQGIFRIHRDVINANEDFGAFTFMDMPREMVERKLGRIGLFRYWLNTIFS